MQKAKIFLSNINEHLEKKYLQVYLKKLSGYIDLPLEVIFYSYKQYISRNHDYLKNKIEYKVSFLSLSKSILRYLISFFYAFIFSKRNKKYEKVEIIFDEILNHNDFRDLELVIKKFSSYKIITKKKLNKINEINFTNRKGYERKFISSKLKEIFLSIITNSIYYSKKTNVNLVAFADFVVNQKLRYETIFTAQKSDILFQFRPYTTSSIKNYIFKKNGGKYSCTYQRILTHLGRSGYFIDADIFFSLGKKSSAIMDYNGSNVRKIITVGSIIYEKYWLKSKKLNTPKFDILYLGGNQLRHFGTDKKYLENYYEQLNWLTKLSKKFRELSIVLKHHETNRNDDKLENKILKGSFVRKIIGSEQGFTNLSYGFANNAKINLTWCSTMAYELLGHKVPCYFLDPNYENNGFLHDFEYNKFWRIPTYDKLVEKVTNVIFNDKKDVINSGEDFCISSFESSKNLSESLKKYLISF